MDNEEKKPKVSVLLTTYNRPKFLRTAIDSVLQQEYQDFELIILDDNSDDPEQKQILMDYWNRDNVIVLKSNVKKEDRKKRVRYAYMINEGFKISRGEYIAYLCDDDFWYKEKLAKTIPYLDNRPDINCLYGQQMKKYLDDNGNMMDKQEVRPADRILDTGAFNIDHSSAIHRRHVFVEVGGWDDAPINWDTADAAFFARVAGKGYKFFPYNDILDCHVYHSTSWTQGRWQKL